ncbi:MAG: hypothetical protein EAX96_09745 [Candidatus Lokiarchaeota archaeon]|nr:hypothetical protein [Candidatus Lokiarchaeota archaeon]
MFKLVIILFFSILIIITVNNFVFKYNNHLKSSHFFNLGGLSEDFYNVEIYNLTLNRTGQIEIGQAVKMDIFYTLNCSDDYFITQNWIDLLSEPKNRTNLAHPVSNFSFTEIAYIDPERFDPDYEKNYTAIANIEIIAINGSIFGKTKHSQETIKLLKANLECSIISKIPNLIFSNEKLNFTCKLYNEHNQNFVFKNKMINVRLYDFQFKLIQNISKSTDDKGNLNLILNFDSGTPGTYHLYLNAFELTDYEDFSFYKSFNIIDINSSFIIRTENISESYVSTDFDERSTVMELESNFIGIFKWNSSFNEKFFVETNYSHHYKTNFINPKNSGSYRFDILGNLTNFNKIISFSYYLTFYKRNLSSIQSSIFFNNHNEIEIFQHYIDNLTKTSNDFDFFIDFFLKVNNNWICICSLNNNLGIIDSKINLNGYVENLNESFEFILKINSTSYFFEDLKFNYSIPKISMSYTNPMKSTTINHIFIELLNKNGTAFPYQDLKIFLNDNFYKSLITNYFGNCSFYLSVSNLDQVVNLKIIFSENLSYISYVHYFSIFIVPNELNVLISNFGIIFSIFLLIPFCVVLAKSQKNKNKMKDLKF